MALLLVVENLTENVANELNDFEFVIASEAIQGAKHGDSGLLRRFAPRNDDLRDLPGSLIGD